MGNYITQILILLVLILMNAFFAGSEIAFISLNSVKLKAMSEEGHRKAKIVMALKEVPTRFLSTIQIGVSLASMLSGAFAADTFADYLANWIVSLTGGGISFGVMRPIAVVLITLITAYLMLVLGELVPKRIAMVSPEKFAFFVCYPVYFISKVFVPLIHLLSISTNLVLRLLGIDPASHEEEVTEEEIRIMVEAGEINVNEKEMIQNVFDFDNHDVSDIMTHRTDMIALDIESDFDEIMDLVYEERFTRYPVYEDNVDNVVGILHVRDLLKFIRKDGDPTHFNIKEWLREPYFVPESKQTDELFTELKANKTHIAIVIDEYGGTAGIVTLEDLIEEVMGNIMDEYDIEEDVEIVELGPDEYQVEGYCDIEELEKILDIDLPVDDYDTVSGFVIGELGRIPTDDDIMNPESDVLFEDYRFSIMGVDEKVVSKVLVKKEAPLEEVPDED
ncbi:hemolysin [Erysipelothrix larvae]|uniref:Hemolysin n=1 Tax=Erysipelothrix larvae TaxID=1514105 RepID=A0A0X8H036_9FIRM|nr:hemolysin family protein [Erysipelothrix larvae]AMC93560.1 hemolysin [Erysipelothrix larvae]